MNWSLTIERYLAEGRTVSGGKGDKTLQQSEQQQAGFNKKLMAAFSTQFGKQSAILDSLTSRLQPMIDNPTGFSPEALAALRTSASDTNAGQFLGAQKALNSQIAGRQDASALGSGVDAQLRAGVAQAGAQNEANSQNNITLQNEQQKQQNFWSSINALSGNAAQYNPLGFAGGATSGSGAVANLGQAYQSSKQSQLLGALGGVAGGAGQAAAAFA